MHPGLPTALISEVCAFESMAELREIMDEKFGQGHSQQTDGGIVPKSACTMPPRQEAARMDRR